MPLCIFDKVTKRGTGWNRQPIDTEFSVESPDRIFPTAYRKYWYNGGQIVVWPGWAAEQAALDALKLEAVQRLAVIEQAQTTAGLKQYTVAQAENWITDKLTNAPNTYAGIKQAVGEILLKMIPYLLK